MTQIDEKELAHLREAARLLAEGVAMDSNECTPEEQFVNYTEAVARWLAGAPPELVDQAKLKVDYEVVKRERDYLLEFADPKEVRAMRIDLASECRGDADAEH